MQACWRSCRDRQNENGVHGGRQWLLDLERKNFMELLATQKTRDRVEYMLKNGKPLRN